MRAISFWSERARDATTERTTPRNTLVESGMGPLPTERSTPRTASVSRRFKKQLTMILDCSSRMAPCGLDAYLVT